MKDKPWMTGFILSFLQDLALFVRDTNKENWVSASNMETNFTKFIFVEMSKAAAEALATRIDNHKNASKVEIVR